MSYSSRRILFVEFDLDFCELRFSQGACSAAPAPGRECYNTLATCPVPSDFSRTTRTIRFALPGTPDIPGVPFYPQLVTVVHVPGQIRKSGGIGARDTVRAVIQDFLHDDTWVDPYRDGRSPPNSSFCQKMLARNRYFPGRIMRVRDGEMPADGVVDLSRLRTRTYLLEGADPRSGEEYEFTAKDLMATLSDRKIPEATAGELAVKLEIGATEAVLKDEHAAQYGAAPFVLALDKEDILVTAVATDTLTIERAQNGTTEAEHQPDTRAQKVKVYDIARPDERWEELLLDAGVDPDRIASAEAATEGARWLSSWKTAAVIRKPTEVTKLVDDLLLQTLSSSWWDPESQVQRFRHIRPFDIDEIPLEVTDGLISANSLRPRPDPSARTNNVVIYSGVGDWSRDVTKYDKDEPAFTQIIDTFDAGAQGILQYGDEKVLEIFAYWIPVGSSPEMRSMAYRYLSQHRDIPEPIAFQVDRSTGEALRLGTPVRLTSSRYVGIDGRPKVVEGIVQQRIEPRAAQDLAFSVFALEIDQQASTSRWAFYAPPGLPAYVDASAEERKYAFYPQPDGLMPNGDEGYRYL